MHRFRFLKIIAQFFVVLALVAPLILASSLFFPFIYGKVILFRISIELALIFYLLYLLLSGHYPDIRILKNPLALALTFFIAIFLLVTFLGIHPTVSFWSNFERGEGGFQMLHYLAFFWLTLLLFRTKKEWQWLLSFSVFICFLVSLYGLGQWLGKYRLVDSFVIITGGRTSGTLGNPSYFSGYLLFHFLFIVWLLSQTNKKILKGGLAVLLAFLVWLYFTTETLAAILAIIVSFLILLTFYAFETYKHYRDREKAFFYFSYLISFLIIGLVGLTIYLLSQVNLYNRLKPRFWTWGSAIQGIKERPFLGWGSESFAYVFDKYHNPNHFGGETWFDRTHNLFLEYLIDGGIVLLIAFLFIFIIYYRLLFRIRSDLSADQRSWLWPIFFVVPIVYFIQGLTLFDVLAIYLALYLFLAFFVHYENGFDLTKDIFQERLTIFSLRNGESSAALSPSGKNFSYQIIGPLALNTAYFLAMLFLLFLIYFGNYLPLQKNLLLTEVLKENSPQRILTKAKTALEFYSPIGQQETYEAIGRHLVVFMEENIKKGAKVDPKSSALLEIMALADRWFGEIKPNLMGIKDYYLYGIWNMGGFRLSDDPVYFVKAKNILDEALTIAPHRMELILSRIDVARVENDKQKETELIELVKKLRPDLIGS